MTTKSSIIMDAHTGTASSTALHLPFRKVAVLGAGVMGSQIAAHLANAGLQVLLLDMPPEQGPRNQLAGKALKKARKMNPDPFVDDQAPGRIVTGNFEDDMYRIAETDWIIEAVVEDPEIKHSLYEKVEEHMPEDAVISTNTSGIPIRTLTEGRSRAFRNRFLGTHFFNPPRYLKLLELIPSSDTAPDVLQRVSRFGRLHLGKGVVRAKDTPNFIGNRIGVYSLMLALHMFDQEDYTIEEIDTLTGTLTGRPKSATFRTADVVGLDTLKLVADHLYEAAREDESRELFHTGSTLSMLVERGDTGAKSGAGFYKKQDGQITSINPQTGEYEVPGEPDLPGVKEVKKITDLEERWQKLYQLEGRAGDFIRRHTRGVVAYAMNRLPEIADSPADVDRAMQWGFGWQMGPFEICDAIGPEQVLTDLEDESATLPGWVADFRREAGRFYRYRNGERQVYRPGEGYVHEPLPDDEIPLFQIQQDRSKLLWQNDQAALWDIGEGVALYDVRTKANSLGSGVMSGLRDALDLVEREDMRGMVIGNEGANFSVGADLAEMGPAAMDGDFKKIDEAISNFQRGVQRVRYSARPVVAALRGKTLGGACEVAMASANTVAATESYIGLVELGVGLIPGGTGTMHLAARAAEQAPNGEESEILAFLQQYFKTVGTATVATSAQQARRKGLIGPAARITMNEDRRLYCAKQEVIAQYEQGYRPPPVRTGITVLGRPGKATLYTRAQQMQYGGFISEYDLYLAERLAYVMTGGDLTGTSQVHEDYLLDLEREVFLSLLGEQKTLERIDSVLKTNKPVRN